MASTSTQQVFAVSSSLHHKYYYDVFVSFRGETRKNFTSHLFAALGRHGFSMASENKLKRGEKIWSELLKAIHGSRLSVIVLSRDYAGSRWCLDELVEILECQRSFQQMVVPVFYHVDLSDVRRQSGSFKEALDKLEKKTIEGYRMEGKMERWREALTEVADLSGWNLTDVADGYESKFIEMIVEDIWIKLNLPRLHVANYPVGIESRIQHVITLLRLRSNDVRIIGVLGIDGIGKTTIAKAIYNLALLRPEFEGSSFLANVSETSKQPNGIVHLQEKLFSDIVMNENPKIKDVSHGIEVIRQRLWCRRVFFVVDDVDTIDQLTALAIRRDWFHSGSKIIVTTTNESLLKFLEVDGEYIPKLLNIDESFQLFNWYANKTKHPIEDYEELSREVVLYAGGHPLALEVLGAFFVGASMPEWKSALESLKVVPLDDIQSKLRISFDSLREEEKDLFLDIACFFVGTVKVDTFKIFKGSGFFQEIALRNLCHRCLIRIYGDFLTIHDMIRDMGRDIARREYPTKPGKCRRLWFHEDVLDVLTNHKGTEADEILVLNLAESNDVQVNTQAFAKMNRLRLLILNYVRVSGSYEHFSKRLRWLCWYGFPLKSIPSNFFMENVVAIDMSYSRLKRVWKGTKILNNLKFLNLSHSYHLTKTPNFSRVTNLETLLLNNCTSLEKVHPSIEYLSKLAVLDMENCKNLRKLPLGIWKLTSLQKLSLRGCSKLKKVLGFKGSPSNSRFSLFSSGRNPGSSSLSLASTQRFISLRELDLAKCNFSYVPDELGSLVSIEMLNLEGNNFCTLPSSIIHLSQLQTLHLSHCTNLQSLPKLPANLKSVVARLCTSLERISIGSDFQKLPFLKFSGCHKLVENIMASYFGKSLLQNQELSAAGEFMILFPGNEVPDYFHYQSVESFLSFTVPLIPNQKIRGWTICAVLVSCTDEMVNEYYFPVRRMFDMTCLIYPYLLSYKVTNKTNGFEMCPQPTFLDLPLYHQDHIWLHYAPHYNLELQMEPGDEVLFSVFMADYIQYEVKMCGVNLIYEDDEKDFPSDDQLAMIQHASSSSRDVILDQDVSADRAVIDNERDKPLRAENGKAEVVESAKRDKPSRAEKGKAVVVESDKRPPAVVIESSMQPPIRARKHTWGGGVINDPITAAYYGLFDVGAYLEDDE